jgi:hypothetical protein
MNTDSVGGENEDQPDANRRGKRIEISMGITGLWRAPAFTCLTGYAKILPRNQPLICRNRSPPLLQASTSDSPEAEASFSAYSVGEQP